MGTASGRAPAGTIERSVCIKIGGKAAADESAVASLIDEMAAASDRYRFFLVHGGGAEVTRFSKLLGLEPIFEKGIRMTSEPEMEVADMVLAGKVNKSIVRRFQARGVRAFGLSGADGAFFVGEPIHPATHTGRVIAVDVSPLATLMAAGYLPVIASVSMDQFGVALNVNADEAAFAIAAALPADTLLFLSDIPGILGRDGAVISRIEEPRLREEIEAGTISGGMIPKVESSLKALRDGVRAIVIGQYSERGDLERLLTGATGSRIELGGAAPNESRSR